MDIKEQAIKVQYHIRMAGLNQTRLAEELKVNRSWISRVVSGSGTSSRVKELIVTKLGFDPWSKNGRTI